MIRRQRGQAMVETALVMPLHIFIILGVIQVGLINNARSMVKYAAYKAARVGSQTSMNVRAMRAAATSALVAVASEPDMSLKGRTKRTKLSNGASAYANGKIALTLTQAKLLGKRALDVVVCGPLMSDLTGTDSSKGQKRVSIKKLYPSNNGPDNEVDFDDPLVADEYPGGDETATGITNVQSKFGAFMRTKMRIQVQYYFLMQIPFANLVISTWFRGQSMTLMAFDDQYNTSSVNAASDHLRQMQIATGLRGSTPFKNFMRTAALAASGGTYVVPMTGNYAMRMQSPILLDTNKGTNVTVPPDTNECITYMP